MPQKRNPDFAEVTRAKTAVVHGVLQSLLALNKGMVSGYNRDSQWSKYLVMNAAEELRETPSVFRESLAALTVHSDRMAAATEHEFLVAVDLADRIAQQAALPFRKAYEIVAALVRQCEPRGRFTAESIERALHAQGLKGKISRAQLRAAIQPSRALRAKKSFGGPAPPAVRANLRRLSATARTLGQWNSKQRAAIDRARRTLLEQIRKSR